MPETRVEEGERISGKSGTLQGNEIFQISHFVRNDKIEMTKVAAGIAKHTYNINYRAAA